MWWQVCVVCVVVCWQHVVLHFHCLLPGKPSPCIAGAAEASLDMALATQTHSNEQMMERLHALEEALGHTLTLLSTLPPVG